MNLSSNEDCLEVTRGEFEIINDELDRFKNIKELGKIDLIGFLDSLKPHLDSIENKTGTNSIALIRASTFIVDAISKKIMELARSCENDIDLEHLSTTETIDFIANRSRILLNSAEVCRRMEKLNMDYAYRIKFFNHTKEEIERICKEKGLDSRSTTQKTIDTLKSVGTTTGEIAAETAGCALEMAIKIGITIVAFMILMAIFGVK